MDLVLAKEYSFTGIVISKDETPLSGVTIEVYDMNKVNDIDGELGFYQTKTETDSNGRYTIKLYRGTFKLVYRKDGFLTKTRTLQFTSNYKVNLGKMVLNNGIELTLTTATRNIYPGQRLTIPFTLHNHGEISEKLSIQTNSDHNWSISVHDEMSPINDFSINPTDSINLNLIINTPLEASGAEHIEISIVGYTTLVRNIVIQVSENVPALLYCEYQSKVGEPSGKISFQVETHNPFFFDTNIIFELKGLSSDWSPEIYNTNGDRISELFLKSDTSCEINIEVTIPEDIIKGSYSLTSSANCSSFEDILELTIIVEDKITKALLETKYPAQSVEIGDSLSYIIKIYNPSESDEILTLETAQMPENWKAVFLNNEEKEVQSILVGAKETTEIEVKVTPSIKSNLDAYPITVYSRSSSLVGSLNLQVNVVGTHSLELSTSTLYEELKFGEGKRIEVKVSNTGYSPLTDLSLEVVCSSNTIITEITPIRVITLNPNEEQVFILKTTAFEGTASGDYLLNIKAVSREAESNDKQLRLSVSANVSHRVTSGLTIVTAIGAIIFVYSKYRRR